MLKIIETQMSEQNAHTVKYLKVQGFKDAEGKIKDINHQIKRDFGIAGPLTLSTPSERVHAIRWATVRECFAVETYVKRVMKETIAAAIAETNKCAYCADVHGASIASAGGDNQTALAIVNGTWKDLKDEKTKSLIEWSLNTRNPNTEIIRNPPFSKEEAPEIIGTALAFHSTNRLVSIFLEDSPIPKFLTSKLMKNTALKIVSKTLFKSMVSKKPRAGESLQFIQNIKVSSSFHWSISVHNFSKVLMAQSVLLNKIEEEIIPIHLAELFKTAIQKWEGEEMPLGKGWLLDLTKNLNETDKPIANLMFLSAHTPHTITENEILAFRKIKPTDKELIEVCFWSIQVLTNKISHWLIKPLQ